MKNSIYIATFILVCMIGTTNLRAASLFQQEQTMQDNSFNQFKGEIMDSATKKPLIFATLTLEGSNISTVTNTEGEFALKIPSDVTEGNIVVSFLGYKTKTLPLSSFTEEDNEIYLDVFVTELSEVDLAVPNNAEQLVRETLKKKGENYFEDATVMTAFYRETIKKRRKNVSLSEAVVNIYKTPYTSKRRDAVELYKARKSTDYSKLDTLAFKLQGGPFNTLFIDIMKYPEYIFTTESISDYNFNFAGSTRVNNQLVYIVNFKQKKNILNQLYQGKLFINAKDKILTSAIYSLNITDKREAAKLFVRRKPSNAEVYPNEVAYRVDYREKNGKWYYGYSNVLLEFKIDWDKRLFNSVYSMSCEMAITDWEKNVTNQLPKYKQRLKSSIILGDEAIGFSDPDFWGEYNIIEPEKSIESAIKKIQRQLKRSKSSGESKP
ncbi:carboxypeptidase-like regulatory domain-containing protein [Costertonia aggregata]|uniref:Carboxypeptidase-like regulatory domain-containing protein n=1 Tax=Costertonia aggregata TaxID=343403 RepID=A0A7H9AL44_9FLAO|nr:carboxypeptidase-like regulatory domain-containing protein [Costertonia aggregata]QLG44127.1 carboxypeptidase-like regulatory domain-containing protein [Costertonia aggregata]